jgi:hypothetical protein
LPDGWVVYYLEDQQGDEIGHLGGSSKDL